MTDPIGKMMEDEYNEKEEVEVIEKKADDAKLKTLDVLFRNYRNALIDVTGINHPHTITILEKLINDLKAEIAKIVD